MRGSATGRSQFDLCVILRCCLLISVRRGWPQLRPLLCCYNGFGWTCPKQIKGVRRTQGSSTTESTTMLIANLLLGRFELKSWQLKQHSVYLLHHTKIHGASARSYRRPFAYRCHAAHATHDWWSGIIHVQHHASHAGNDSAHVRNRLLNTASAHSFLLLTV